MVSAARKKRRDSTLKAAEVPSDVERSRREQQLVLQASVFTHARAGIVITALDGTILDVNDAFLRITGYGRSEVLGQNPRILSSGRQGKEFYAAMWSDIKAYGHWQGEVWNRRKSGEVYAEMLTISALCDAQGQLQHYMALFSDITEMKEHQHKLEQVAHFDVLTGLPNRALFLDRLQQGLAHAQRRHQLLAVVFIDLDGFKAVNDTYGHEAGDHVLTVLGSRMRHVLRAGDTLARLGGDEFAAVLVDVADEATCVSMLNRLLAAAAEPVQFDAHMLRVSASVGVSFFHHQRELDGDQLLRQADQAMYQAKAAGRNCYRIFCRPSA